jgi:hypothetical protein
MEARNASQLLVVPLEVSSSGLSRPSSMVEQLTLNRLHFEGKRMLGAVLGAIDRYYWRILATVLLAVAFWFGAVSTRYEVHRAGSLVWRVDRWTGTPEFWAGDSVGWLLFP